MTSPRAILTAALLALSPALAWAAPPGPAPPAPAPRAVTPAPRLASEAGEPDTPAFAAGEPDAPAAAVAPREAASRLPRPVPRKSGPPSLASNDVLVILRDGATLRIGAGSRAVAADPALAATLGRLGIDRATPVGHERTDATRRSRPSPPRIVRLSSTAPGFDAVAAAQALRATGRFRAVCPNYRLQPFATFPNDYYLPDQWYVHDPAGGDVHLPEAWDFEKGGSTVTIGIMDTGVDIGHPDLATRIWTNPGEVPGNGVDDDGNGYIDDVNGWDFGNDDADPDPEPIIDEIGLDIGFHGTFVAGIAAAAAGNAQGIAGASWNCLIVPLKVANAAGDITVEAVTPAFLYAADQHLSVLNMSLGSAGGPGIPEYFQALVDVADSAGVLCVAAAGNDGVDTPTYPAGCDRVLAVGAMDMGNVRAEFSNFGSWVDVAAPGASMWSTICRNYVIDDTSQLFYYVFFGWDGENPYMYGDGTSFACPLVSGVCALVRHHGPALTPEQVATRIVATGEAIAFDQPIGPKLNAYRAVNASLLAVEDVLPETPRFDRGAPNPFRTSTVLSFTTTTPGPVRLRLYDLDGRLVRELVNEFMPAGRHERTWNGASASGARLAAGVYLAVLESGGLRARQKLVMLQ
jgi:subtilisin family serine protease